MGAARRAHFATPIIPGTCTRCSTNSIARLIAKAETKYSCLLYTSDAADERSSVDLGGRRIIKKKKKTSSEILQQQ